MPPVASGVSWLFLLFGLFLWPLCVQAESDQSAVRRPLVLTLHSYSASPWDNELQNGINHELIDPGKIDIYVDYMDAKKLETPEYLNMFCEVLKVKYQHLKFDLVIVCDESAYQYARTNHDQLWPDTPVVFCGVNEFRPAEFSTLKNMTGIAENTELSDFVASFRTLLPRLKKLYIVRDDSTYSQATLPRLMEAISKELPKIQVEELTDRLSAVELANRLAGLPKDSAVFYLSFWRESGGRIINKSELQRVIQQSNAPVFTTHQSLMGNGATGICYVDAFQHGVSTGKIARQILEGADPASIPATRDKTRQMAFDHAYLKRYNIPHSVLPAGSIIFNEPSSFYQKYKTLVWATSLVFALLLGLLLLLAFTMIQRRRITLQLAESEEKFARAFHDAPAGMFIYDTVSGRCIEINEQGLAMLGCTRADALNQTWGQIGLPSGQFSENPADMRGDQEIKIQRNDGRTIFCTHSSHAIKIGGRERLLVILVDITSHKHAEAERKKLQTQLNQSQKMELIGRLAGGVAHDFNNMLTAIQINATEAKQSAIQGKPASGNLDEIVNCAQRSAALTQRLLAFARKQPITPKILDLNQTVESSLGMIKRLIGEKIEIEWNPRADLWPAKLDPNQIDQILTNLCVNARDAIAENGRIIISTLNAKFDDDYCQRNPDYLKGEFVRLMVRDTGCGMSREIREHIFEPFFTTKEVGKGTGLGLPTVYGIVQQNNGFILVDSDVGRGTTIRIYLPCHAAAEATTENKSRHPSPVRGGHETILLVEDEPSILQITENALRNLGYTVIAANTPKEALRLAEQHSRRIDLLVTDVVMPGMNGRELEAQVLKKHSHIKSLFISGYTPEVIMHEGILNKGVNFLPKPFTVEDIARAIREVLGELSAV
ncbi:MAG: ABC transporter substrate binding protein [Nibricoccus sp.]